MKLRAHPCVGGKKDLCLDNNFHQTSKAVGNYYRHKFVILSNKLFFGRNRALGERDALMRVKLIVYKELYNFNHS